MKKLENKIFILIFAILSLFTLSVLTIFQLENYEKEKKNIENSLRSLLDVSVIKDYWLNKKEASTRFIDATIYTIVLDDNNEILGIISHTEDENVPKSILSYAEKIKKENKESKIKVGNLYTTRYSYIYNTNNYITIIDNIDTNERLTYLLQISILLFLIIEIILFFIAKYLSLWITKPIEESFEKQKQFIADASHELKTPLAVIMASADALVENPKEKKWIGAIQEEADRMNQLIKSLLDLAKVENEQQKLVLEEINLSKIVEKSLLTLESLLFEKQIVLNYEIPKKVMLKGNEEAIKELLSILMDNAIKHSNRNGSIMVSLEEEKKNIILKVKNKGKPIPKEEEEKIFERFYRGDKSRNRQENCYGLGLAIAKKIVENHNGTIKAHSSEEYTTFTVYFRK